MIPGESCTMSKAYISNDFITESCWNFIGLVIKLHGVGPPPSEADSGTDCRQIPIQSCLCQLKWKQQKQTPLLYCILNYEKQDCVHFNITYIQINRLSHYIHCVCITAIFVAVIMLFLIFLQIYPNEYSMFLKHISP